MSAEIFTRIWFVADSSKRCGFKVMANSAASNDSPRIYRDWEMTYYADFETVDEIEKKLLYYAYDGLSRGKDKYSRFIATLRTEDYKRLSDIYFAGNQFAAEFEYHVNDSRRDDFLQYQQTDDFKNWKSQAQNRVNDELLKMFKARGGFKHA